MKNLESEIISRLRWPLMVLVILIHSDIVFVFDFQNMGGVINASENYRVYGFIRYFLCDVIGRTAVPLFFFISGYLFFCSTDEFSWSIYKKKIESRFKTLVIPFFLWNAFYIMCFFLISRVSNDEYFIVYREFNISEILLSLWTDPPCFPFWFIRDLIVMCSITIFVYPLLRYGRAIIPSILLFMWFACLWPSAIGFSSLGCVFFHLGAWCGIHKIKFPECVKKPSFLVFLIFCIVYFTLGLIETALRETELMCYIHNLNIIVGITVIVLITLLCINHNIPAINKTIASSSFFLFGFHGLFIKLFRNIIVTIMKPADDIAFTSILVLSFVITIAVGIVLYSFCMKIFPKTTSYFCGGR